MRMSAYEAPSRFAVARATSASELLTASTSAAAAASRSRIRGARLTVPSAVDATLRNSRLIIQVRPIFFRPLDQQRDAPSEFREAQSDRVPQRATYFGPLAACSTAFSSARAPARRPRMA